jgi:hypothetical protein
LGPAVSRLFSRIDAWCAGRNAWLRAPALAFFLWVWLRHAGSPAYRSVFGGLNLGVHELGHFVFGPFGDVIGALGGSVLQCLLPLAGMVMFVRQGDWFAVAFAWGWLATNLFEVSVYAADAVVMRLPLVTPGGGHAIHDWNYILGALGWLRHTERVAGLIRWAGHASMLACVAGIVYLVSRMLTLAPRKPGGGGFAARPREVSLRPGSESDPPGISTPQPSGVTRSPRPFDAGRSPSARTGAPNPGTGPVSRPASPSRPRSTPDR